jgi:hypothetical protein
MRSSWRAPFERDWTNPTSARAACSRRLRSRRARRLLDAAPARRDLRDAASHVANRARSIEAAPERASPSAAARPRAP